MSDYKVLNDIKRKIERERNIINSSTKIRESTDNAEVKKRCNSNIREAQRNLEYLTNTLDSLSISGGSTSSGQTLTNTPKHGPPNFTRLDLIKYKCPSLGHRIQYMMQLLEFKLQIENQYKAAGEKMQRLYQNDADKHSSSAAMNINESIKKIPLLTRALKRYKDMHIDLADIKEETDLMSNQRLRTKPPTGIITIGISSLIDIDHVVSSGLLSRKSESIILIKVDDELRVRSKPFRNGRLTEELNFQMNVDKNNEIELTVCDKIGNDKLVPVAIAWFMIPDIVEEVRRRRKMLENSNNNWVSASSLTANGVVPISPQFERGFQTDRIAGKFGDQGGAANQDSDIPIMNSGNSSKARDIKSSDTYMLEPNGSVVLTFGFIKTNDGKNSTFNDNLGGLGRHGAIRDRKENVFEQHGHHFVQKNIANILMCAYCGEFTRYSCFQCQNCRFLCHKKCYKKVVIKCISKSSTEVDPDEAKVNHKIPHRFEPVANRGTKWCCHCGFILPWGKKNVRKCTECGVMCHAQCAHLVPDFCGMSMIMASNIMTAIQKSPVKKTHQINAKSRFDDRGNAGSIESHGTYQPFPSAGYSAQQPVQTGDYNQNPQYNTGGVGHKGHSHNPSFTTGDAGQFFTGDISAQNPGLMPRYKNEFPHGTAASPNEPSPFENDIPQIVVENDYDQTPEFKDNPSSTNKHPYEDNVMNTPNPFDEQQPSNYYNDYSQSNVNALPSLDQVKRSHEQERQSESSHDMPQELPREEHASPARVSREDKPRRRRVGLDDFQFLAVLGKGNFGKVMLAESRTTSKLCAIKVLKKDFIIENDEVESMKSEKRVFLIANKDRHPFLINLHCCFQTANRIYFVMEYVSGGDLMWHIQQARFSQRRAQFYAAEVLLGLKYFHDNGVIYRDLKLDNILLTAEGHIKIADYGLCKEEMWYGVTTSTFCGTPEFMAPEILRDQRYGKAVDWWAFGVLLYQMLLGQSPFRGGDEEEIFNAILTDEPLYPIQMARESVEVLQALLTRDQKMRLGASERDAEEIMEHPYFRNINFDDILNLRVAPPYLPELKSEHDVSNFDDEFTAETPRLTPVNSTLDSSMQEKFRGFSHMSDDYV